MTKCNTAAHLRRRSVMRASALLMNSALALLIPGVAHAAPSSNVEIAMNGSAGTDIEMVVITGRKFNPEVAPSKSSLETTEPQTIISRSYIEDSQPATTDYVGILSIVPSMTGTDINGPGLSDGNVKNTLRGQPDGNFGISYDGIPFGDTNGPTHHSESYFPGAVIGGVTVDRGPGNAGNIGPATFGGSIFLFSEGLTDDPHLRLEGTGGSWDTYNFDGNVQTGTFDTFGFDSKLMVNMLKAGSTGYLTLQSTHRDNELVKYEADIAPNWTLTLFGNWNALHQVVNDNNGATPAQITNFGINFALQNTNPSLPTFAAYSHQNKITDMDYLRLKGEVTENFHVDDQAYTYAYVNKTVTTTNITQTQCDITPGATIGTLVCPGVLGGPQTAEGLGTATGGTVSQVGTAKNPVYLVGPNALGTAITGGTVTGAVANKTDIAGYTKLNAYRVWGNTLRASWDYEFGRITGQLRAGVWWEDAATQRQRFYFDVTQCFAAAPCNIFKSETTGVFADSKQSKGNVLTTSNGLNKVPGVGYYEHSSWDQYQPFLELEIHPFIDDLTITPGIKYVWWNHSLSAPVISASKPPVPFLSAPATPTAQPFIFTTSGKGSFTTTRTLPFATVNYKIEPYWSTYFEYAQGIYVPDISAFEQKGVVATYPKPQTTTNYQWGMVFYGDNFSVDGDIYYVDSKNTISFTTGGSCPPGDTCATNIGAATYKGIEGESTYAFGDEEFHGLLDGLSVFANGSLNSAKSGGIQLKQAPFWTAASGLVYKNHGFKLSLIDKVTGQQYSDNTHIDANGVAPGAPGYLGSSFYKLGAYNTLDFTGYYDIGQCLGLDQDVELGGGVYNLLDSHKIVGITINDATPAAGNAPGGIAATSLTDLAHRPLSVDQYYFQAARSFQLTLKVRW